ncbi:MAG: epoxyqueuosine reductase [Ruminococcus sp.]|nr:epoxyqueuosine reductase [Ruminococcus sp.]
MPSKEKKKKSDKAKKKIPEEKKVLPPEEKPQLSDEERLKEKLVKRAHKLGINKIRFANVERWEEFHEIEKEFYPQSIWPWSRTVISLAVQIFPSMIETTPSVVYSELYNTTNRYLDEAAYLIANYLNQKGYRAHFFPRDCYGDISVLVKKPEAAFSHVIAGKYAGMGTIGMNHTLLTPEFGPRIRLVSVITDAVIPPDDMFQEELCLRCKMCVKNCPTQAFTPHDDRIVADMDKFRCAAYHQKLKGEFRYPCGVCVAVCPVGADKKIYGRHSVPAEGIAHCQNFGSKNAVEALESET